MYSESLLKVLREADAYTFMLWYSPQDWVRESTDTIRHKDHHSLVITKNKGWYSFKDKIDGVNGGRNLLNLVMEIYGLDFKASVEKISSFLSIDPMQEDLTKVKLPKLKHVSTNEKKLPQPLPPRAANNEAAIAYLCQERDLDNEVVERFVELGDIYQSDYKGFANVVFVNPDSGHWELRGITTPPGKKPFRRLSDGENYWCFVTGKNAQRAIVCESAIDAISFYELYRYPDTAYFSIAGCSHHKLLEKIIAEYGEANVTIAFDNDDAGRKNAELYPTLKKVYPESFKDWNEELQATKYVERMFGMTG